MAFQPTAFQNDTLHPIKAFQVVAPTPPSGTPAERNRITLGTVESLATGADPALGGRGSS